MPPLPLYASLALVPLLIALNAFFVAAEYALVAIRGPQIKAMRRAGRRAPARAMAKLKEDPAGAIGAIQVCITMTNLMLGWIGEPAMGRVLRALFRPAAQFVPAAVFDALSLTLSFVVVTLLTVVFSELLPKALTLRYVPAVATFTAVPVLGVLRAARPLVWLMNAMANAVTRPLGLGSVDAMEKEWHTAEEIRQITSQAAEQGALTSRERSLILNSLALGRRKARQVMVPRVRVIYADLKWPMERNRKVIDDHLYGRLPLCDGGMDHVMGWVSTKEFLAAYHAAGESSVLQLIARPAVFEPEGVTLDRLLTVFHQRKTELVFLVDEYGGVEGIVTLQDVVDELLSELGEPVPPPAAANPAAGDTAAIAPGAAAAAPAPFSIPGDTPVHELALRVGRPEWAMDATVTTAGGLVVDLLGRVPAPGEAVEVDGVVLRAKEVDERTVRRVEVTASAPPGEGADGSHD
jgi:CBS domain containing-hemolysin-like protein